MPDYRLNGLREAYARDVIDLDTLEELTAKMLGDEPYVLPMEVWPYCQPKLPATDAPGSVIYYRPVSP